MRAARRARRLDQVDSERRLFRHVDLTWSSAARVARVSLRRCVGRARARQTGWSGAPQVLVSTAHGHKSDGEEEVSGHAPFLLLLVARLSGFARPSLAGVVFVHHARSRAGRS